MITLLIAAEDKKGRQRSSTADSVMNRTVKSFLVGYNPINESNVFSNGDVIRGQVMLELTKDTDVNALGVKLKGKAEVRWTEKHGKRRVTYHSKEKYFSIQQLFFQKDRGNNHVSRGTAVYPFTFQIPAQDLPPSFKGQWGRIVYTLEACLSRPMRLDSKTSTEFLLVSKTRVMDPSLMVPQHGVKDKQLKLFNSGYVAMDVNIDKTGFQQGEGIRVVASIQNKSSRDVRPKYCIYTKHSFFARGKRRLQTMDVLKDVGDAIPPSAGQTITKVINVPATLYPSIHNCNNIKVEYRLRVYLDVKYVSDPEIKFPIVILPIARGACVQGYPTGFEAFTTAGNDPFLYPGAQPSAPPTYQEYGIYPPMPNYYTNKS